MFPQLNAQLSIKTIAVNLVSFTLNEPPGGGHDTREKDIQAKDTQYTNENASFTQHNDTRLYRMSFTLISLRAKCRQR